MTDPDPPTDRELHITVVTGFGDSSASLDVSHETALVKAALLYADRVTLASPRVALLATVAPFLGLNEDQRATTLLDIMSALPGNKEMAKAVHALEQKRHKTVDDLYRLKGLRAALREGGANMADAVENILDDAGIAQIDLAMSAGVLDLDALGMDEKGDTGQVAQRVADLLTEVTAEGSTTFPLLDESTAGLLGAMVREGVVPRPATDHLAQPAIATRWIGQVEAYPHADMAAVLELRDTLKGPLVRYRRAIIEVTDAFRSGPLDEAYAREAGNQYRKNVTPELVHLEELARDKRVTALLKHAALTGHPEKLLGATMGFVGASEADLPQILGGVVGVGLTTLSSAIKRRADLSVEQRRSAYFFLYELERQARKRRKQHE